MIDEKTAINGVKFHEFHKYRLSRFVSFANQKGTNFDKFEKWKNAIDWWRLQENNEQRLAKSIDYAHGLELDDFGDDIGLDRNGMDDETYRFYLKAHKYTANSKGTYHDLSILIASLLGCDTTDISMANDRHYDKNGNLVGKLNTVNIQSIDFNKVKNPDFMPLVAKEVQKAALAGTKINQLGFYTKASLQTYASVAFSISKTTFAKTDEYIPNEAYTIYPTVAYQIKHTVSANTAEYIPPEQTTGYATIAYSVKHTTNASTKGD